MYARMSIQGLEIDLSKGIRDNPEVLNEIHLALSPAKPPCSVVRPHLTAPLP